MPQTILALADYPNIDLADIGKASNIGYGSPGKVPARCIVGGATALLTADITATATSFSIDNAERFPVTPFTVQIGSELLLIGARTGTAFSSITRGYGGTTAKKHSQNRTVFEVRAAYVWQLSAAPVKTIKSVYVDGVKQLSQFTAYTGATGDEHPDWPGEAVVAFTTEAFIGPQRNLDTATATSRSTGEDIPCTADKYSNAQLIDGDAATYITLAPTAQQTAWAGWPTGLGSILKQVYACTVENTAGSEQSLHAIIVDSASGVVVKRVTINIPATTKLDFNVTQTGGNWATHLTLKPISTAIKVFAMSKTVTRLPLIDDEAALVSLNPAAEKWSHDSLTDGVDVNYLTLTGTAQQQAWISYPSTSFGTIDNQDHKAKITNNSGSSATIRLQAVTPAGLLIAQKDITIATGTTATEFTFNHADGGWDTMSRIVIVSGTVRVHELYKTVNYATDAMEGAGVLQATSSARIVIGDVISVDADWTADPDGNYGGVGTLIERPDWVIKHALVQQLGDPIGTIDATSFSAAGTAFAAAISGGYKFGFAVSEKIDLIKWLTGMAYECGAILRNGKGVWYLDYIPDAAPAAVKTLTTADLHGEHSQFAYDYTDITDLINQVTTKFKENYVPERNESQWMGTATDDDAASQAKYGAIYPLNLELQYVRSQVQAAHLIARILLRSAELLLRVKFPIAWDNFALAPGQTIEISDDMFNGKKYMIEPFKRQDQGTGEVEAIEWW